ncbi:hypothetical protein EJ03DRAFT_333698 [Teratosphaeria nubilosa]|uniref:Uncharacterized protein n=1 Tax=Teratosphaeria nubilosa TaxID=161662 RepID=A0A6G1LKW8_9PEZI|nr:hypothetical protein EJ03DRAFT_333698 [Teratosphaeria nubilosa]
MALWLTRFGSLEARGLVHTVWNGGKRKTRSRAEREWACSECRKAGAVEPWRRRCLSGVAGRSGIDGYWFSPREESTRESRVASGSHDDGRHVEMRASPRTDIDALAGEDFADSLDDGGLTGTDTILDESSNEASPENDQESLWERFEQSSEDAFVHRRTDSVSDQDVELDDTQAKQGHAVSVASCNAELLQIDYKSLLSKAINTRDMDLVARCLLAAERADDTVFIASISQETFSEVLSILEPANNIDMLVTTHVELSPHMEKLFGLAPMQKVAWEYAQLFDRIVKLRRTAGIALTFEDFNTLLRSARDIGHKGLAIRAWYALLAAGHLPTVQSWNYYMGTALFDRVHGRTSGHKMRIIPFNLQARKAGNLSPEYASYRVGKYGVQHVISRTFNQMLQDGVDANEESYRIVMTAAAREGEIGIVKTILRKVWGVDVDAIMEGATNGEALVPKQIPANSDKYPTDQLLFTIAHAFSINNNIPAALRLVDFVARHYNLTIFQDTWAQLFEWTFVLANPRSGGSKVNRQGQLPLQSPLDVWNTITGEPYCVKPTMGMYSRLIQNLHKRNLTPLMMEKMEEGLQLHLEHIAKCRKLWRYLKRKVNMLQRRGMQPDLAASINRLRQEHDHAELLRKRNRFWLKRWVRLLLATMRTRSSHDTSGAFALRHIPSFLWRFESWAPSTVRYDTVGGIIEIKLRSEEQIAAFQQNLVAMAVKQQALLKTAPKLVGEAWMRSIQPRATRRMRRRVRGDVARGESAVPRGQSKESGEVVERTEVVPGERGGNEAVRWELGRAIV